MIASELIAKGIIPCSPTVPPDSNKIARKLSKVKLGFLNAVHQPVERMSSFFLKDVTTKPKVGMVHKIAITVTTIEAMGDVNGRLDAWPLLDISASFLGEGSECCNK